MKIRKDYTCPLEIVHDFIKGKWKLIILFQLRNRALSLSELERQITGINQKMLLEQLRELQEFELVYKETYEGYPLHVQYSLTEHRGRKMIKAIEIMQEIGIEYMFEIGQIEELEKIGILYPQKSK